MSKAAIDFSKMTRIPSSLAPVLLLCCCEIHTYLYAVMPTFRYLAIAAPTFFIHPSSKSTHTYLCKHI